MRIIISGDGDTGTHLARQLSQENQDVLLMGTDDAHLGELDARYNIMTMNGRSVSPSALTEAGVSDCGLFIAVTPWENGNMISCQLAKMLGARRTVARIDNSELMQRRESEFLAKNGVDELVYPEYIAAKEIVSILNRNWTRRWFELHNGEIIVAAVKITKDSPLAGVLLREFAKSRVPMHVAALRRGMQTIIPRGDDMIEAGDVAYFTLLKDGEDELLGLCGMENRRISRILISGAGRMTRQLAPHLSGHYKVTVIDSDVSKCRRLSQTEPSFTIVNIDQKDIESLREEHISECDAFIALNDSSEMNIIGSMLAKASGVPLAIAEIEDLQYFTEAENLNIDAVVNKKLLTSSTIFQMILDGDISTPRCLAIEDAEVAEIVACEGSRVTRKPISELNLPSGITLAGLIRDGKGMLVSGETHVLPGDHLVIFCLSGSLDKFMKFFR